MDAGKPGFAAQLAFWRQHGRVPVNEADHAPAVAAHLAVAVFDEAAEARFRGRLTTRGLHALTPQFWTHVNSYGRFDPDMRSRITVLACPEMASDGRRVDSGHC